jgi:hypothetical protein
MTLYTVYAGTLSGPAERSTEDPALAMSWGRDNGPDAFVTAPCQYGTHTVWTPASDRRCVGGLHEAIISAAMTQATS